MKRLLINFAATVVLAGIVIAFLNAKNEQTYQERQKISYDANDMIKWIRDRKVDPATGEIDYKYVKQIEKQVAKQRALKQNTALNLYWEEMGPDKVGGRTRSILVDKNNTNTIYIAAVSGGLWKSTNGGYNWFKINDYAENLSVTSLCQTEDGTIYYGTGENQGTGFIGNGIYKSTDGVTFTNLANTNNFQYVNKLAAYGNTVYAATSKGLYRTTDGGENWEQVINANQSYDVAVASNGKVYTVTGGRAYMSNDGSNGSFQEITSLPHSGVTMASIDVAPSNPDYVYISLALNSNDNPFGDESGLFDDFDIYRTTDGGTNWESIRGNYNESFQPFKRQSSYNNIIKVYPNNPDRILLGGVDLFEWTNSNGWKKVSYWVGNHEINQESYYLHADQHAITFHPDYANNKLIYFGNDGGFFISKRDGYYLASNLQLNITQFYNVDCGPTGQWIAGAQDNGTQFNARQGVNLLRTTEVLGGDGFACALPELNKNLKIGSLYYGQIYRITETGQKQSIAATGNGVFHTPLALWESYYDPASIDSVEYYFEDDMSVGDTIYAKSNQGRKPLPYVLKAEDLAPGDTNFPKESMIKVWDYYQAMLATTTSYGTFVSTRPINLSETNIYYTKINEIPNGANLAWSNNGDALFFSKVNYSNGTTTIYRASGILSARIIDDAIHESGKVTILDPDKVETISIGTVSGYVTSIIVDPNVSNNVMITTGGYSSGSHVYYSNNAATTVSNNFNDNFHSINGNLPGLPVYTGIIAWNDSRKAVLGTEYGIYVCDDITAATPNWTLNSNFPSVAVYDLVQQTVPNSWKYDVNNHGYIYAATFGRGVFMSKSNAGPVSVPEIEAKAKSLSNINIYPNPATSVATIDFNLKNASQVNISVININGQIVKQETFNGVSGNNKHTLNVSDLEKGVYFINLTNNNNKELLKLIVK